MRLTRTLTALTSTALLTGACATAPTQTPLLINSQPVAIIMAAGIIAPDEVIDVTRRAVAADPSHAAMFAATAVRVAPQQEAAIRAVVVQAVPAQADAVRAAMKAAVRTLPTRFDTSVRTAEEILSQVERAIR